MTKTLQNDATTKSSLTTNLLFALATGAALATACGPMEEGELGADEGSDESALEEEALAVEGVSRCRRAKYRYYRLTGDAMDGMEVPEFQISEILLIAGRGAYVSPTLSGHSDRVTASGNSYNEGGDKPNWANWKAFDSIATGSNGWNVRGANGWLAVDLSDRNNDSDRYKVTAYRIYGAGEGNNPKTLTLAGSNTRDSNGELVNAEVLDVRDLSQHKWTQGEAFEASGITYPCL